MKNRLILSATDKFSMFCVGSITLVLDDHSIEFLYIFRKVTGKKKQKSLVVRRRVPTEGVIKTSVP